MDRPVLNEHGVVNWVTIKATLKAMKYYKGLYPLLESAIGLQDWDKMPKLSVDYRDRDLIILYLSQCHISCIAWDHEAGKGYIADAANETNITVEYREKISKKLGVELIGLSVIGSVKEDLCASGAVMIGIEFCRLLKGRELREGIELRIRRGELQKQVEEMDTKQK